MKLTNIIAPAWPLKHLVATNPMAGFQGMPFCEALKHAHIYFQQQDLPEGIQAVNRVTIKWLQAFFDQGQATIMMPERKKGLLSSIRQLLIWDKQAHQGDHTKQAWLKQLPQEPDAIIDACLKTLAVPAEQQDTYLSLLLTTLPGWSAYIQYRVNTDASISQMEYLALRLILNGLLCPTADTLLSWHEKARQSVDITNTYEALCAREKNYQDDLLAKLKISKIKAPQAKAQWVCCIDVRSEPLRRALEASGEYETFGFAGFFGVPVSVEHGVTGQSHASCPVLLKPAHRVAEYPQENIHLCKKKYEYARSIKRWYQSLKYTFTTPFSLVDAMGFFSGVWMGMKTFFPGLSGAIQHLLKTCFHIETKLVPDVSGIPMEEKISYAANMLHSIGLTQSFLPLVILCGHGSSTQNNAHATALDCGACGGNKGGANARILAVILNDRAVRVGLKNQHNIAIPEQTAFMAAQHNTTTGKIDLDMHLLPSTHHAAAEWLQKDIALISAKLADKQAQHRANDWAQVRPEWGLARNASFIIGPRWLTQNVDLEGRAFLHSYEWEQDTDASILTGILTAPMIVAQWINAQYFFSTLDPIAFGCGSKITTNVCGKIGVMQGNTSDLMHGLPLQSLFVSDTEAYHSVQRLLVVIYAPEKRVSNIIAQHPLLRDLFRNQWIHLVCLGAR